MEKDGSKSFVKMSAASVASAATATATPSAKPKKAEGGIAKAKDSLDINIKKVVSSAVASLTSALSSSATPAASGDIEAKPKP